MFSSDSVPPYKGHDIDHLRAPAALGESDILDSLPAARAFANTQGLNIGAGFLGEAVEPGHNTGSSPRLDQKTDFTSKGQMCLSVEFTARRMAMSFM
jgi:hypothetical protein